MRTPRDGHDLGPAGRPRSTGDKTLAGDYAGASSTFAHGWNLRWTQTFHPAYELQPSTPGMTTVNDFARITDSARTRRATPRTTARTSSSGPPPPAGTRSGSSWGCDGCHGSISLLMGWIFLQGCAAAIP
ncbi:hypothetical protein BV882_38420 [Streptomyces sp. 46]|nr:hypothetical protein BV882_38420 [Streptomyces sp. 46]